jgi:hypothetical protein
MVLRLHLKPHAELCRTRVRFPTAPRKTSIRGVKMELVFGKDYNIVFWDGDIKIEITAKFRTLSVIGGKQVFNFISETATTKTLHQILSGNIDSLTEVV